MVRASKMLFFSNRGILSNLIISNIIVLLLQPTVNTHRKLESEQLPPSQVTLLKTAKYICTRKEL